MPEDEEPARLELRVPPEGADQRLDRYLADALERPRNRVQRLIREGVVTVEGERAKPGQKLESGARVLITGSLDEPADDGALEPEAGPLQVLHEEEDFIVLDKPAGLVMHPGAGNRRGTLAHRLLHRYPEVAAAGSPRRPGIVHRLDQGTSGVLVVARSARGYDRLSRAFAERRTEKWYLALVYGCPEAGLGIDAPLGRHPGDRKRMAVRAGGRPAESIFEEVRPARGAGVSLIRIRITTGRTHQIRVHAKHAGHPIVGDETYGEARWKAEAPALRPALRDFPRPALHASRLAFPHPRSGRLVAFESALADDIAALWRRLNPAES